MVRTTISGPWRCVRRTCPAGNLRSDCRPNRFTSLAGGIRYARVQRFPYIVLFDSDDEELRLLGVLHTARSIEKWREQRVERM